MTDLSEFHATFEMTWTGGVLADCVSRRIRTEGDMVASLYHHLRNALGDKQSDLSLTVEKRLRGERQYWIDLVVRKNQEWWVVIECKLHVNPNRKQDRRAVRKDLGSLLAARSREPRRAYLCYLLKPESRSGTELERQLDAFEHRMKAKLQDKPDEGYLWIARGIRASKATEEDDEKSDCSRFKPTWKVLPWGVDDRKLLS